MDKKLLYVKIVIGIFLAIVLGLNLGSLIGKALGKFIVWSGLIPFFETVFDWLIWF